MLGLNVNSSHRNCGLVLSMLTYILANIYLITYYRQLISHMIVYGIPNCNTVKKSLDWLKSHHIDFEFHDFKKKGITEEKLNSWCNTFGWETVLNRKGLTCKKLTKDEQAAIDNQEKAIEYLMENTSADKRPILEQDGEAILISFDETLYGKTLA